EAKACPRGRAPRGRPRSTIGTRRSPTPPAPEPDPAPRSARRPRAIGGSSFRGYGRGWPIGAAQRLGLGAVQELDGRLELRVLGPIRRHIGVGALLLLLAAVLQMASERGFAHARDLPLRSSGMFSSTRMSGSMPWAWIERPEGV